jgi:hypothetical protein
MDWGNERYVRVYTRDTTTERLLCFEAFAGLLSMGLDLVREAQKLEARIVAIATGAPMPIDGRRRVRSRGISAN